VPFLAARGHAVRAASRRRGALEARGWHGVELTEADSLAPRTLDAALAGTRSPTTSCTRWASGRDFPRIDREPARSGSQRA